MCFDKESLVRNATDINIVLDRSGSMQDVRDDTIGGFNAFIAEQKKDPSPATVSLMQFDTEFESVMDGVPLNDVKPLTYETFVPRGMTALLDAIGRQINLAGARLSAMPESDRPDKVVFVIMTDGEENSSREFTRAKVFDMISHQQKQYNWQFVFLGANQDAIATGSSIGIATANAMTYAANSAGTSAAFCSTGQNVRKFRSSGLSGSLNYSGDQRDEQAKAGATN